MSRLGASFDIGWATALVTRPRQVGKDVSEPRMLLLAPQLRFALRDYSYRDRWYAGPLDLVIEPQIVVNFEPTTGLGGALNAGVRYRILPGARVSPYVMGLVGLGGIDFDLVDQANGFQFFLQGAVGLRVRLNENHGMTFSARYHHISNAQTHFENDGIDALAAVVGFDFH